MTTVSLQSLGEFHPNFGMKNIEWGSDHMGNFGESEIEVAVCVRFFD